MCIPDFLALIAAGNAHVTGELPPEGEDLAAYWAVHNAHFMWVLSPGFSTKKADRDRFISRLAGLSFDQVCADLDDYIRETFADAPRARQSADGEASKRASPVRVSFAAFWIYRLASRMHWSREEILSMPLRQIFQFLRIVDADDAIAAGKSPVRLSDEVDHLWGEYLAKLNALDAAPNV